MDFTIQKTIKELDILYDRDLKNRSLTWSQLLTHQHNYSELGQYAYLHIDDAFKNLLIGWNMLEIVPPELFGEQYSIAKEELELWLTSYFLKEVKPVNLPPCSLYKIPCRKVFCYTNNTHLQVDKNISRLFENKLIHKAKEPHLTVLSSTFQPLQSGLSSTVNRRGLILERFK